MDKEKMMAAHQTRALMVIRTLPFGVISKSTLSFIAPEDEKQITRITSLGILQKTTSYYVDGLRSMPHIRYELTPKAVRRVVDIQGEDNLPQFFIPLNELSDKKAFDKYHATTSTTTVRVVQTQNAITFFNVMNVDSLLQRLWYEDQTAILLFSQTLHAMDKKPKDTFLYNLNCAIASNMANSGNTDVVTAMQKIHADQMLTDDELEILQLEIAPTDTPTFYTTREAEALAALTNKNQFGGSVFRDNAIGFFYTPREAFAVYITQKGGMKYNTRVAVMAHRTNIAMARMMNDNRAIYNDYCCTSAIYLAKDEREFARAVLDPYEVRNDSPILGDWFKRAYLIPFNINSSEIIQSFVDEDPGRKIAGTYRDTQGTIYNLTRFELHVLYAAMSESEKLGTPITIGIHEWQRPYFQELESVWQTHNISDNVKPGYGFKMKVIP